MTLIYPVDLRPEPEGGYTVTFPDIPEAITCGEDETDALAQAADCLETALAFKIRGGEEIPPPSKPGNRPTIALPAVVAAKVQLHCEMLRQNVIKAELARRLHCWATQIDRLLDLSHESKLSQIEAAFAALGKRLELRLS